jgi:hypothetical protein
MRQEPSLTFRGALEILGHHDRPAIKKLDKILGGAILASGVAAGVAAVAGLPLAPVGLWAAIWGWTEQKDAAMGMLRKALDSAIGKVKGTVGYERRQLIAAAHTTIVMAAVFEAFRDEVGEDFYESLEISDAEKATLLNGRLHADGTSLFGAIYAAEVPAPSPSRGFEENVEEVRKWMLVFAERLRSFLNGLAIVRGNRFPWGEIVSRAAGRYESHFLKLAATVPEFAMWAVLAEHAATRALVRQENKELAAAIDQNTASMARVEALLALTTGPSGIISDLRVTIDRANQRTLSEPIVSADGSRHGPDITFPPVKQMYINPRFQVAKLNTDARVADERWWNDVPSRAEFDLVLAAHVITLEATRFPMLLLGDPGAGKSLGTRVLAARLGGAGYTVVHVPLRNVGANAPVGHQIQQALDAATTERVTWAELSDQSVGTTRIVLLDGLDELLQASSSDRSGYLQEVVDFQAAEAAQERPLVIMVTSRIVVADRVDIPRGTTVVKLDTFTKKDIADWLGRWQDGNSDAIASGTVRALTVVEALRQPELARQPLLLLMLAIYAADPALPPLDADLSTADLYRSLLEEFGRREARKGLGDYARGPEVNKRVQDHIDRLAIAALAMFNRGRQDISEDELGTDLKALDERLMGRSRPDEAGQRVIAEFFFVHAPEARMLTSPTGISGLGPPGGQRRRTYEFMHTTFGEYLVASRVMAELSEVASKAFAGRRGPSDPQDDLLFALLSHQTLAARKSILTFAEQIAAALPSEDRQQIRDVLEMLLETYRDRHGSGQYSSYQPTASDAIRQLAYYSANLVSLRVALEPDHIGVPLATLLRVPDGDGLPQWRSLVRLWHAGLDDSGMQAMLTTLKFVPSPVAVRTAVTGEWLGEQVALIPRLIGDRDSEWRTLYGAAIWDHRVGDISHAPQDWVHEMSRSLIPLAAGLELSSELITEPPSGLSIHDYRRVAALIFNYLRNVGPDEPWVNPLIKILFQLPKEVPLDGYALARSVILRPELLNKHPELRDPQIYGRVSGLIDAVGTPDLRREIDHGNRSSRKFGVDAIRNLLTRVVYDSSSNWRYEEPNDSNRD